MQKYVSYKNLNIMAFRLKKTNMLFCVFYMIKYPKHLNILIYTNFETLNFSKYFAYLV